MAAIPFDVTWKSPEYIEGVRKAMREIEEAEARRKGGAPTSPTVQREALHPTLRQDAAAPRQLRATRTGQDGVESYSLGVDLQAVRVDDYRQDAADAPAPKPAGAVEARRSMLARDGMRPEHVAHRMGLTDRSSQIRHDANVAAKYEAAAEARRIERERALQVDRDRRARYDADAQRRLDAALASLNRPASPPAGFAPPSPYQQPAAAAARARLEVQSHLGSAYRADDARTDQHHTASGSASEARRRLFNSGH